MNDTVEQQERLIREGLNAYQEEYRELSETWRNLDAKAQGTIAISGIFLAGILAFVRALSTAATSIERLFLAAATALLTLCIVLSLLVLRIRTISGTPAGKSLEILINDLLQVEDGTTSERLLNYCRDQMQMWSTTNHDIEKANQEKADLLIKAQVILVIAIGCAAILTLIKVWS